MIKLINENILKKIINKDEIVVIAVSTGIDSMSLFHFLYNCGYKVVVAHVNHKRRPESDLEYEYLENLCNSLNVPFNGYIMPTIIKGNFQEEARKLRYEFFKSVADKFNTKQIVVAHQKDDKVETILMRLIRGTALRGYSGIREVSYVNEYKILRPLLNTTRETIQKYQQENDIKYFEDSSNSEDHYTRNIIRHKLVPVIKEINSGFYSSFDNYSDDVAQMYRLVDKLAFEFIDNKCIKKKDEVSFSASIFDVLDEIIKRQIILRIVNYLSNNTLELSHQKLKEIVSLSINNNESKTIEIGEKINLSLEYQKYVFYIEKEHVEIDIKINGVGEYFIDNNNKIIVSEDYNLLPNKKSYLLCYNNTDNIYPICVRNVMEGDKITVNSITKKVYDVLKEHKVPKRLRKDQIVFLNESGIFFIPGILRKETIKNKENKIYITCLGDNYEN